MTAVYVFGGLLALLVASVVFVPLIEMRKSGRALTAREQRDQAIEALQELEFEYQTGKLSREDYEPLRTRYARQAIEARDALIAGGEEVGSAAADTSPANRCGDCGAEVDQEGAGKFCTICGASVTPAVGNV